MQLDPRYGTDPVILIDGPPASIAEPVIRQRRRLAALLAGFSDEQWAHPSRCEGWSNQAVINHLDSTNSFWSFSIGAGLRGEPSRFLATFDPVASPAQLVAASNDVPADVVLERFAASTDGFVALLESLDDNGWSALAEAPPGHIAVSALVHHALWDSWVHERDVLLPMGIAPDACPDEIAACLRYAAALGPAFALNRGDVRRGTLRVDARDPDVSLLVEIGDRVRVGEGDAVADLHLSGSAVGLLEALSIRVPFEQQVAPESAWMLNGLATTFDVEGVSS